MARAKTAEPTEPSTALVPHSPKRRACCGTCKHWLVFPARQSLGRCLPSMAVGSTHIVTPDLGVCSAHEFNEVQ